ncbi:MAG: tyrosine-type recombinase/integrase [Chloroflexota bacterium]|nr:tyrosine-type recombinase/integrase [Chloroflexota bacterium]
MARVGGQVDPATGRRSATRLTRKVTKTAASQATVAVPGFAVDVLRRHRLHQTEERLAARAWNDNNIIFSTEIGTFLEQRNVLRRFKALAADAGIGRNVRVHDLRHTTASHMIDAGVPLVVVQATLRHTRVATTADVYTHQLAEVHRSGATAMDARLRSVRGSGVTADGKDPVPRQGLRPGSSARHLLHHARLSARPTSLAVASKRPWWDNVRTPARGGTCPGHQGDLVTGKAKPLRATDRVLLRQLRSLRERHLRGAPNIGFLKAPVRASLTR